MTYTFDQSKDEIARLVKHFSNNRLAFQAAGYKEAQARQEFIDPLFIALNWDVYNHQQAAPDYREVVVEDSLDMGRNEAQKAPDYVFRVGRDRKFFAEAKKPGVDIKTAVNPAYQLRRYAWSAKLPLSILTDFHEWAAYDCRIRPSDKDKSSAARLTYMTYEEYADRWREVWDVFSREAVWGGSFDNFAQGSRGKRGSSEVDAEFLKEIEGWRNSLAHNIALRNPDLTLDEMNDAVQRTIDRIIFLRMSEARGIEEYGQIQRIAEGEDIYAGLLSLYKKADIRYNSGLFDFSKAGDKVTPRLSVDDKTLKPILSDLYFPKSPYEFSVLPVEILGNVYEQFLGKVIHLTGAHHAKIEEKPEVKKAGGVYYTPSYIVEYIVNNTVGQQIEGKSPAQLKGFRVLDPACGSGSFLVGAYTYLLDYYRDWYAAHESGKNKEAVAQQADGSWQLTLPERKRILTEHIFGVDIDRQAVEVTKLSLLLKVLEGVKQLALFNERALPNLDSNIKCGNSLIGTDYFAGHLMSDDDELRRVNPFDWKQGFPEVMDSGGFDCVIGNPPYVFGGNYGIELENKVYFKKYYYSGTRKINLFTLFLEKSIKISRQGGLISFIIPNTFLRVTSYANTRQYILENTAVRNIVDLGSGVFIGATTSSIILLLEKNSKPSENEVIIQIGLSSSSNVVPQKEFIRQGFVINIRASYAESNLLPKLNKKSIALGELCNELIFGVVITKNRDSVVSTKRQAGWKPFLEGKDISRYTIHPSSKFLLYDPKLLHRSRTPAIFDAKEKLLIQRITGGTRPINAAYDSEQYYDKESINNLLLIKGTPYNIKYILGLLNSRLINWFYRTRFTNESKLTVNLSKEYLSQIPIHSIEFILHEDKSNHDKMVSLVEQMLDLHKRKVIAKDVAEQEKLQRMIDSTDEQIDTLVYELYELTPKEIAIVEGEKISY